MRWLQGALGPAGQATALQTAFLAEGTQHTRLGQQRQGRQVQVLSPSKAMTEESIDITGTQVQHIHGLQARGALGTIQDFARAC